MDRGDSGNAIEELASGHCQPCDETSRLTTEQLSLALKDLPGWVHKNGSIEKVFHFRSYLAGLEFAYSVGRIAQGENHHSDMLVGWRRVRVTLSTHAIKGLSRNDFIMAARAGLEYSENSRL